MNWPKQVKMFEDEYISGAGNKLDFWYFSGLHVICREDSYSGHFWRMENNAGANIRYVQVVITSARRLCNHLGLYVCVYVCMCV